MPKLEKLPETSRACAAFLILASMVFISLVPSASNSQQDKKKQAVIAAPQLTRTTTRHESRRLGYGSAVTILGAPAGSITIEGWNKSEVDVTADIELRADTEDELAQLAVVNSFMLDKAPNSLRIITTGTHDKKFMKNTAKDFPKKLLAMPWKIDYHVRVPMNCDLEIDAGRGAINLSGVDGAINLRAVESDAQLTLTGGIFMATIAGGKVNVNVAARSWRGRGAEIRLALGDLTVQFLPGFSGDVNADVLRTGRIENLFSELAPLEDTEATPRSLKGRSGAGGAVLNFIVGDGNINIKSSQ